MALLPGMAMPARSSFTYQHCHGASRRPAVGDVVTYEIGMGKNGKSRAAKVCSADQPGPKQPSAAKRHNPAIAVWFTGTFLCLLLLAAAFGRVAWLLVAVYLIASLVAFAVYAWDKSSARAGRWRTPESNLHFLALIGGWPGALAAQRLLRHKSSKSEFLTVFWVTVALNIVGFAFLTWSGDAQMIEQLVRDYWRRTA